MKAPWRVARDSQSFGERRGIRWANLLVILASSIALIAVALSPLLFRLIGARGNLDWARLSDIGQAYGGISAILSGMALFVVALSTAIQVRQASLIRSEAMRTLLYDMLKTCMAHPETLWPVLGGLASAPTAKSKAQIQQRIMAVQYLNYLRTGFVSGEIPEGSLRMESFPQFFSFEPNRQYWMESQAFWRQAEPSRRGQRFLDLAAQAYERAEVTGEGNQPRRRSVSREFLIPPGGVRPAWVIGVGTLCLLRLIRVIRKRTLR